MKKKIVNFLRGFYVAFSGIYIAFQEKNMKIHGLASICVILANIWWQVTYTEWLVTLLLIGSILSLEIVNSAIEDMANIVRDTNKLSYQATKVTRDLAAGAVLTMSIIALITAMIIYLPYIFK